MATAGVALSAPAPVGPDPRASFVGSWHCAGHFVPSGKPIDSDLRFERDVATGALIQHHQDRPPMGYAALEVWSVQPSGAMQATIVSAGAPVRTFESAGWSGDTLDWTRSRDGRPVERFSYRRSSDGRIAVTWSRAGAGGSLQVGDVLQCTRS